MAYHWDSMLREYKRRLEEGELVDGSGINEDDMKLIDIQHEQVGSFRFHVVLMISRSGATGSVRSPLTLKIHF